MIGIRISAFRKTLDSIIFWLSLVLSFSYNLALSGIFGKGVWAIPVRVLTDRRYARYGIYHASVWGPRLWMFAYVVESEILGLDPVITVLSRVVNKIH